MSGDVSRAAVLEWFGMEFRYGLFWIVRVGRTTELRLGNQHKVLQIMNPEIKSKWTAALLSGEYQQGQDSLYSFNKFCCLGVLCDLYRKEHPETSWEYTAYDTTFLGQAEYLPEEVQEWADLNENDPRVKTNESDQSTTLSSLNDSGKSFKQIAELIEEQL